MEDTTHTPLHKIATFLINNRYGIVAAFAVLTIFMVYAMTSLKIETGFKKQLPLKHEYMQTFLQYEKEFGGANRVLVALSARDGDMFDAEFFTSLESIIGKYEDLIMKKIGAVGFGLLQDIIADLDQVDSIRCFFAALFLARDQKVDLEQAEDDIKITIMKDELTN